MKCERCQAQLPEDSAHNRKYCDACRRVVDKEQGGKKRGVKTIEARTCSECPTVFSAFGYSNKLTCSPGCQHAREARLQRERDRTPVGMEERACEICLESYTTSKRSKRRTCGKPDCQRALRKMADALREDERRAGLPRENRQCQVCGGWFETIVGSNRMTCGKQKCVRSWSNASRRVAREQEAKAKATRGFVDPGYRGKWGLEVDPWATGMLGGESLPPGVSSWNNAIMTPFG